MPHVTQQHQTLAAPIPVLLVDPLEAKQFCVDEPGGIGTVLSDIAWLGATLKVHTASDTTVVVRAMQADLREQRLLLERGLDASDERALSDSAHLRFEGAVRGAPVVFETGPLRKTKHKGKPAFEVPFPDSLYYVQRRRHFRAPVRQDAQHLCTMRLGTSQLRMQIVDISLSGVRLREVTPGAFAASKGMEIRAARLDFGMLGQLVLDLRVMGCRETNATAESVAREYGCAFLLVPRNLEHLLQRIVTSLELQAAKG